MQKQKDKELKIIVGNKRYDKCSLVCHTSQLKGKACDQFYCNFDTVAFVVSEILPYKVSFEGILSLIFYNRNLNIRQKYIDLILNKFWEDFVEEMYVEHNIVFINQNEIDLRKRKTKNKIIPYLKNSHSVLVCGSPAEEKINKIIRDYKLQLNTYKAIHPAPYPTSLSEQKYLNDWVDIKTNGLHVNDAVKATFMI